MKSIFTIHAGEFIVGEYIERKFRNVLLWLPSRDTGIDFLVTDVNKEKSISLQVKFSRDFLVTHMPAIYQEPLRASGWWTLNRKKIITSPADYWVFVLKGLKLKSTDFIIIRPKELLSRLDSIHEKKINIIQCYICVTSINKCWETRGLNNKDQLAIANNEYTNKSRDLSSFLNNWGPVRELDETNKNSK